MLVFQVGGCRKLFWSNQSEMWPSIWRCLEILLSQKEYLVESLKRISCNLFPPSESHPKVYDSVPSHCLWISDDAARECLRQLLFFNLLQPLNTQQNLCSPILTATLWIYIDITQHLDSLNTKLIIDQIHMKGFGTKSV